MNCIIVDDDIMARKSLERLCAKVDFLTVVDICENGEAGLRSLEEYEVDLIFLDIEMPGISGIDLVRESKKLPQVIFTTSKTEYAFEAFEFQVTDYLKKPINFSRFKIAIDKAFEIFNQDQLTSTAEKEVYLREDGKFIRVEYSDILYFENVGDYIRVKTIYGNHIIHGTLKSILAKLNYNRFMRVHRSFVIHLDKIKDIQDNTLVIDKKVIPISRANKAPLFKRLNLLQ